MHAIPKAVFFHSFKQTNATQSTGVDEVAGMDLAQNEVFYTVPDLIGMLKVKRDQINSWIASGKLKAIDLNKTEPNKKRSYYRIPKSALDSFMEAHSTEPPPSIPKKKRRTEPRRFT